MMYYFLVLETANPSGFQRRWATKQFQQQKNLTKSIDLPLLLQDYIDLKPTFLIFMYVCHYINNPDNGKSTL